MRLMLFLLECVGKSEANIGWHYLSNATCLIRPHVSDA